MSAIAISVRPDLVTEIILRSRGKVNLTSLIENIVESFLERTRGDPDIWSPEHAQEIAEEEGDETLVEFGAPSKGYQWQGVLLPNGTALKTTYKNKDHFAEVRHQQLFYEGSPCSPSQFASRAANNTSRNAWRDIWIKRPTDKDWIFADAARIA